MECLHKWDWLFRHNCNLDPLLTLHTYQGWLYPSPLIAPGCLVRKYYPQTSGQTSPLLPKKKKDTLPSRKPHAYQSNQLRGVKEVKDGWILDKRTVIFLEVARCCWHRGYVALGSGVWTADCSSCYKNHLIRTLPESSNQHDLLPGGEVQGRFPVNEVLEGLNLFGNGLVCTQFLRFI